CRGHRAGVVLWLREKEVGEGVDRQARRSAPTRTGRRAGHPEGREQLVSHDVEPAATVPDLEQSPERGVADVGAVESTARAEPLSEGGVCERLPVPARGAFPPRSLGLRLDPTRMRQQLLEGQSTEP